MLADSLPDKFGNAVIDSWLAAQGRLPESFDAVERLCYTGSRGMGALEFEPALSDFNLPGAYSYEQAAMVMRRLGLGQGEVDQLYRRMCFNIVARNQDDHVKKISFLMDRRGVWKLAPAYDMTHAYNPDGSWTGSHQMTMNGKRDGFALEDFLAAATSMNIKRVKARRILGEVAKAVSGWLLFAEWAGVAERAAASIQETMRLSW